ncbi:hypothetical protein FGO68_gene17551 [Halteria grandinella]|uniref:Uncharacterized protein n=1 Tax=Halteria grandinella TaxID=5974 RepID=A0A8J8NES5_HALGN|nr:hypothetical protein FGO68_gene17551 [Halteria grandinella]
MPQQVTSKVDKVKKRNAASKTSIYNKATSSNVRYVTELMREEQSKTNISGVVLKEEGSASALSNDPKILRLHMAYGGTNTIVPKGLEEWDIHQISKFRSQHRRKLPVISQLQSLRVSPRNLTSISKTQDNLAFGSKSLLNQFQGAHSPEASAAKRYQDENNNESSLKKELQNLKNPRFQTLNENSPGAETTTYQRDHSQIISLMSPQSISRRSHNSSKQFVKRFHHQRASSLAFQSGAQVLIQQSTSQYGQSTPTNNKDSSVTEKPSYLEDTTSEGKLMQSMVEAPGINESIPYLISKEGPNAHQFKFQVIKRVNHVQQQIYRNMLSQHQDSMKSSKDQYSSYLTGVKKKPFFNPDRRETKQLINHQRNNTSAFNPLASHYDDPSEHTQNTFKAGSIVEKVKEELNKTINAKRRLLERNFINFRFDEFKKGQQQVVQQLEEIEKKKRGSPQKGIENHPIKNGMWKSIEVYTPQHYAQFQNMMTARQNIQ